MSDQPVSDSTPATTATVKAGWKGGTLEGGYLCPVEGCGRRMTLHLLDKHLTGSTFGGHGITVEWTIRVCEVPKGATDGT